MYCGGVGFYETLKTLNSPSAVQEASFFCLRTASETWQFLALDTGLHDFNPLGVDSALTFLEDDELEWHCERIREFPDRTILLSHHQLFSAFSAIAKPSDGGRRSSANPRLLADFRRMSASGRISAWFWGHEHTLGIYKNWIGLERGRCIGHGAVPVSVMDHIYEPLNDLETTPSLVPGTELALDGHTYGHGFAVLKLKGETCEAKYVSVTGVQTAVMFSEEIS